MLGHTGKVAGSANLALLGGKHRDSVLAYANGWYRTGRTPEHFVEIAEKVVALGFKAVKLDPFGTDKWFCWDEDLHVAYNILNALRKRFGPELRLLIDVHSRFAPSESLRIARTLAPLNLFW